MNERDEFAERLGSVLGSISGFVLGVLVVHIIAKVTGAGCALDIARAILQQLH